MGGYGVRIPTVLDEIGENDVSFWKEQHEETVRAPPTLVGSFSPSVVYHDVILGNMQRIEITKEELLNALKGADVKDFPVEIRKGLLGFIEKGAKERGLELTDEFKNALASIMLLVGRKINEKI